MLVIDRTKIAMIRNANYLIDWEAQKDYRSKIKKFIDIRRFKEVDGTSDKKDFKIYIHN